MVRVSATLNPCPCVPPSLLLMLFAKVRSVSLYPSWYCKATSQESVAALSSFFTCTTALTGVLPCMRCWTYSTRPTSALKVSCLMRPSGPTRSSRSLIVTPGFRYASSRRRVARIA